MSAPETAKKHAKSSERKTREQLPHKHRFSQDITPVWQPTGKFGNGTRLTKLKINGKEIKLPKDTAIPMTHAHRIVDEIMQSRFPDSMEQEQLATSEKFLFDDSRRRRRRRRRAWYTTASNVVESATATATEVLTDADTWEDLW